MTKAYMRALKKRWVKRLYRLSYADLVGKMADFMCVLGIESPPKEIAPNINEMVANGPTTPAGVQETQLSKE